MSQSLKIAIAEDEIDLRTDLEETLQELGHQVVISAGTGRELIDQMDNALVDLVITDIRMPDVDGLTAIEQICALKPVPVVIITAFNDNVKSLQTTIKLAAQRFREFQALQAQTSNLQQALDDRKIIERAKGILMDRAELSEPDAFRRLQLLSSQKNQKMIDVAHSIVEADSAFRP